jgi:hypothetical protein
MEVCTVCTRDLPEGAIRLCVNAACRKCCGLACKKGTGKSRTCEGHQTAHPPGQHARAVGAAKRAATDGVKFPAGTDKLTERSSYLIYCPHSLVDMHLRTGRGVEMLYSKILELTLTSRRSAPKGEIGEKVKSSSKGKWSKGGSSKKASAGMLSSGSFDWRDEFEVKAFVKVAEVVLDHAGITTMGKVDVLQPLCERLYKVMVLKREGGGALVKKFEDVTSVDDVPTFLRRATALAKRSSASLAKPPMEKLQKKYRASLDDVKGTERRGSETDETSDLETSDEDDDEGEELGEEREGSDDDGSGEGELQPAAPEVFRVDRKGRKEHKQKISEPAGNGGGRAVKKETPVKKKETTVKAGIGGGKGRQSKASKRAVAADSAVGAKAAAVVTQ